MSEILQYLPFLHLLRVPETFLLLLLFLPVIALTSARPLLFNLFDLDARGTFFAVLTGIALAWSVLMTGFIILRHNARFGDPVVHLTGDGPGWLWAAVATLLVIPTAVAVHRRNPSRFRRGHTGACCVAVGLAAVLGIGAQQLADHAIPAAAAWLGHVPCSEADAVCAGYVENGSVSGAHLFAVFAFVVSASVYGALGWFRWRLVPTLAYVYIWLTMLCWTLGALVFFFDAWRMSALLTVAVVLFLSGYVFSSRSDHYFQIVKCEQGPPPSPEEIIGCSGDEAIVVAANGGGIQSAAWTARVMTGLELCWRAHAPDDPDRFRRTIRLMSGVSGGSAGSMHFLSTYRDPLPEPAVLEAAVRSAKASSLADVAWGLVYPDFLALLLPHAIRTMADRGNALERAWVRDGNDEFDRPLSSHYDDVRACRRPAVVYNATITETGERLLLGTTRIRERPGDGRRNLNEVITGDVKTVTAARLSATFPFVTPVARPDDGKDKGFHVADGGYYDNYGTVTALEWLDEGLRLATHKPKRILFLEIHGAPARAQAEGTARGWAYQLIAPIAAMLSVRTAGQLAHKTLEAELIDRYWKKHDVEFVPVTFDFRGSNPPLSWHLGEDEQQAIEDQWNRLADGPEWQTVRKFLDSSTHAAQA